VGQRPIPLLDLLHLHVRVPALDVATLQQSSELRESSATVRARVIAARGVQADRARACSLSSPLNAHLSERDLLRVAVPEADARAVLTEQSEHLGGGAETMKAILRVARTIADLAGSEDVKLTHVAEAAAARIGGAAK